MQILFFKSFVLGGEGNETLLHLGNNFSVAPPPLGPFYMVKRFSKFQKNTISFSAKMYSCLHFLNCYVNFCKFRAERINALQTSQNILLGEVKVFRRKRFIFNYNSVESRSRCNSTKVLFITYKLYLKSIYVWLFQLFIC